MLIRLRDAAHEAGQSGSVTSKRSHWCRWDGVRTLPPPVDAAVRRADVHLGRQAVYDRRNRVVGYELLFRDSAGAASARRCGAYATCQVLLNACTEFGLAEVVGDRICFINLTREFVTGDLPLPVDPGQVVLELLETVLLDDELIAGALRLVDRGFDLALDGFVVDG